MRNRHRRPRRVATLHATIGERLPALSVLPAVSRRAWAPSPSTKAFLAALAALPKIAASIGAVIAAHPDARVEVLPGTPTTIAFVADRRIKSMFILPISERDARRLLGHELEYREPASDRLWEEGRQADMLPIDSAEPEDTWAN